MATTTPIDRYFKISERGSTLGAKICGGLVTCFAMCYIIVLNPVIIGTVKDGCVVRHGDPALGEPHAGGSRRGSSGGRSRCGGKRVHSRLQLGERPTVERGVSPERVDDVVDPVRRPLVTALGGGQRHERAQPVGGGRPGCGGQVPGVDEGRQAGELAERERAPDGAGEELHDRGTVPPGEGEHEVGVVQARRRELSGHEAVRVRTGRAHEVGHQGRHLGTDEGPQAGRCHDEVGWLGGAELREGPSVGCAQSRRQQPLDGGRAADVAGADGQHTEGFSLVGGVHRPIMPGGGTGWQYRGGGTGSIRIGEALRVASRAFVWCGHGRAAGDRGREPVSEGAA
jgi:hypothetical protein